MRTYCRIKGFSTTSQTKTDLLSILQSFSPQNYKTLNTAQQSDAENNGRMLHVIALLVEWTEAPIKTDFFTKEEQESCLTERQFWTFLSLVFLS